MSTSFKRTNQPMVVEKRKAPMIGSCHPTRIGWRLSAIALAVLILGCGPSVPEGARITGTVTLDGKPIPEATIVLRPTSTVTGRSTEGKVVAGAFDLKQESGVFGPHRVEIYAHRPTQSSQPPRELPPGQIGPPPGPQYLSERYNRRSTLTCDVKPGENQLSFKLTSQGR